MLEHRNKPIFSQYVFAILIILVVSILARAYYDNQRIKEILNNDIKDLSSQIHSIIEDHLLHVNIKYIAISSHYQNDESVQTLVKTGDREELYKKIKPDYDIYSSLEPSFYGMQFYDNNNITLLRMHRPDYYDDNVTEIRSLIESVHKDRVAKSAFEVGRSGAAYRIAVPLITKNNEYLGTVEYGIEPDYFYNELQKDIGINAQIIVKTNDIEHLSEKKEFKLFKDYSIVRSDPVFEKINRQLILEKKYQIMDIDDKTYVVFNDINFNDSKGREVSKTIIAKDITPLVLKHNKSLFFIYGMNFLMLLAIYFLFRKYTDKTYALQNDLQKLNSSLESKVAEQVENIKKSHLLLATIFETTKNGIALIDLDSTFKLTNGAFERLTGYKKDELNQRTCFSLTPTNYIDNSKEILNQVIKNGYYEDYEQPYLTKNENIIHVMTSFILMPDKTNILLIATDITEKKEHERELKKQEEKFLQQSRMAQMGEMISMIAHQWRQPLGAIASTSIDLSMKIELETFNLKENKGREECQAYFADGLKNIDELVQNLTTTIDDFRNFYKPNKESDFILLHEPIHKALSIIRGALASDSIEIVEKCTSKNKVKLYSNEIMQVILNILKNAQDNFKEKATKNPKITITCRDSDDKVITEICDNGAGIAEDILPKIFNPYFSTKNEKNGTGLGLHMCKTIVEDHHGGRLEVSNREDGVCFAIILKKSDNVQ
ncbi:MAG: ATP-binding protein [Sulfurimonas sp.]|jgi:PAS domain S-box-containing protein